MSAVCTGECTVLVIDVGGSHVKCVTSVHREPRRFPSGCKLTAAQMVREVLHLTADWHYDAVSLGYPGVVRDGRIVREPRNLGKGWVDFDFKAAFGCPLRIINDAAMQALGSYTGGKMLFLGLGTGLGSALIVDGVIAAMELGHLHFADGLTYEDCVGDRARRRVGNKHWRRQVRKVVKGFRKALLPDLIVLGGGNAVRVKRLPRGTNRGDNDDAFVGGLRLWRDATAPSPTPGEWD